MTRIFPITGLGQDEGDPTGIHQIRRDILLPLEQFGIDVEPVRRWDEDWEKLAIRAKLDGVTEVISIAYSWGAGWATPKLCRELQKQGIDVSRVVLIDPVYRPGWAPAKWPANIFGFRALIPGWAKISIPDNVALVVGIRQTSSLPMGHAIRHHGRTFHLPAVTANHLNIDEHPRAKECAYTAIQHLIP